ncbi:P2Y purinoceptor 14 [Oryzias melastigma]|uniref:P2Y purinoceptor 14 n=1 Tax=Oryzias melastigma TaxID=30732 RepID=A0A834F9P9_ORYME|nr:P2Y purinoceptor 14 [Oryzias melastigma]
MMTSNKDDSSKEGRVWEEEVPPHLKVTLSFLNMLRSDFSFCCEVLLLLYWLIFAVGLPLNCLTAWILFRAPVDSGLMVYMKNMVVADLLMVLTFPFKALMEELQLLVLYCHYVSVLSSACMYVEILFIGLISLERYGRIFQHASRSPSTSSTCSSRFGLILKLHCLQRPSVARVLAVSTW